MITYDEELRIYYSTKINDTKYFSAFGTRDFGDGRDIKSIKNFLKENDIEYKQIVTLDQIHSTNIAVLKDKANVGAERIEDTDGVIAQAKNTVLTTITADCLPLVFVDKKRGIIGISHQGWRGSLKRLAVKMIVRMVKLGSRKKDIIIAIGPGIGICCYDVDEDRYFEFKEEMEQYSDRIFSMRQGQRHLNLLLLNYLLLIDAGIKKENIDFFPFCTRCNKKRFFSLRGGKGRDRREMFNLVVKL